MYSDKIIVDFRLVWLTYYTQNLFPVNGRSPFCVEFWSCRSKYTLLALSYYSSQKCCLGGAKLSEDTRPGEARQLGLCSYKKHIVAARLTTNLSESAWQKMRIMVMLLEEKKKKQVEVNCFFESTQYSCLPFCFIMIVLECNCNTCAACSRMY